MKRDYTKYFKYLFIGLLICFLSFDISFGVSPINLTFVAEAVGFVFIVLACKELKEISPKFKLVIIFAAISLAVDTGLTFTTLEEVADISVDFETTTVISFSSLVYQSLYINALTSLVTFSLEGLVIINTLGGLVDFVNNENIKPLIEDCETQYRKIKIVPFVVAILIALIDVLSVPTLHALDGIDLEDMTGALSTQLTTALGFAMIVLLVSIVSLVFGIIYLVRYIKALVLINRFKNVRPYDSDEQPVQENVIDADAYEIKKDDWQDDFK